jgi:CIC family chloride channel protein
MTSVLMIFEMTRDYSVIVPLMIANLASLFISSRFQRQPIYEALAHQDGIHLPNQKSREEIGQRKVFQVMRSATETLAAEMNVHDALELLRSCQIRSAPVMDQGRVIGVLARNSLESAVANGDTERKVAHLIDSLDFPHVHLDHPLHLALERMSQARLDVLPVVNRADIHTLEGVVTMADVLDCYGVEPRDGRTSAGE